ncbi:MAG: YbhB/YbcL family Raf kinase inhibitor-like protein [Bdellovibrionales bacterium]
MGQKELQLRSPAFDDQGDIPPQYTCEGDDTPPPLEWNGAPAGTRSYVLIVDDPDAPDPRAPERTWVHWVVYNIPGHVDHLNHAHVQLPEGAATGVNDWKNVTWGGPCPPVGKHRYFFKLYALDTYLNFDLPPTKSQIEQAMQGHILTQAELVGRYAKHSQIQFNGREGGIVPRT